MAILDDPTPIIIGPGPVPFITRTTTPGAIPMAISLDLAFGPPRMLITTPSSPSFNEVSGTCILDDLPLLLGQPNFLMMPLNLFCSRIYLKSFKVGTYEADKLT
ncbi:103aa long hypothetical protein [Pyrococcus horikoshii OT3]|uniref:Uncharacterized protein n=1 Tax=Pyrococcus horikoshii (strain ATCC 700860 / DSM 12428 / JCM 9974 / NBRC 100139 / OT-3) TaxID=70601 RepID=O58976_PYRHO|nr:103aa long hypothetical protein [Pyrococcus horikoshii OT3]